MSRKLNKLKHRMRMLQDQERKAWNGYQAHYSLSKAVIESLTAERDRLMREVDQLRAEACREHAVVTLVRSRNHSTYGGQTWRFSIDVNMSWAHLLVANESRGGFTDGSIFLHQIVPPMVRALTKLLSDEVMK